MQIRNCEGQMAKGIADGDEAVKKHWWRHGDEEMKKWRPRGYDEIVVTKKQW